MDKEVPTLWWLSWEFFFNLNILLIILCMGKEVPTLWWLSWVKWRRERFAVFLPRAPPTVNPYYCTQAYYCDCTLCIMQPSKMQWEAISYDAIQFSSPKLHLRSTYTTAPCAIQITPPYGQNCKITNGHAWNRTAQVAGNPEFCPQNAYVEILATFANKMP